MNVDNGISDAYERKGDGDLSMISYSLTSLNPTERN